MDGLGGEHLAGLVVLGEGLEQLLVAEELFQHLRRHLDEVALGGKAGDARPLRLAAQDGVHQVAELVEEGDHVGVLQQAGIALPSPPGKLQMSAASGRARPRTPVTTGAAENHLSLPSRGCMSR